MREAESVQLSAQAAIESLRNHISSFDSRASILSLCATNDLINH